MIVIEPTLLDFQLSDAQIRKTISRKQAEEIFSFFQTHPLFNWSDANNGCEGRADAICVLLDAWKIPNYKAWAFSARYLKNGVGELKQNWKYHVAAVLSVEEGETITDYVIDPATGNSLKAASQWAADITQLPHSYYCIRNAEWYIFPASEISTQPWNSRNRQNRKWMIQCLAGINSLTATGKAQLCFHKNRLKKFSAAVEKLKQQRPFKIG